MNRLPLFAVYGVGGCGRGVLPLAREQLLRQNLPNDRLVFIDDSLEGKVINGHRVLSFDAFAAEDACTHWVAIAVANGAVREKLSVRCSQHNIQPWTIQAHNIVVMDQVQLGDGAILSPFVTLTSNIRIGNYFHANLYSYVEHDCTIGDYVTFAPGVQCNGNVIIEDHAYIGSGAIIKQGLPNSPLVIGRGAVIGMGAVVTKNVPQGITVIGNPATPWTKGA